MTEQRQIGGACLCGAVRFSTELPTKWSAHCHCSLCRRAHGAAFVTWVGVADAGFALEAGEDMLNWYASTPEANRGFCSRCGTTMFFKSKRWPDEMHIVRAVFDDDLDRSPRAHVFMDDAVDWVALGDELPRFGTLPGVQEKKED